MTPNDLPYCDVEHQHYCPKCHQHATAASQDAWDQWGLLVCEPCGEYLMELRRENSEGYETEGQLYRGDNDWSERGQD